MNDTEYGYLLGSQALQILKGKKPKFRSDWDLVMDYSATTSWLSEITEPMKIKSVLPTDDSITAPAKLVVTFTDTDQVVEIETYRYGCAISTLKKYQN